MSPLMQIVSALRKLHEGSTLVHCEHSCRIHFSGGVLGVAIGRHCSLQLCTVGSTWYAHYLGQPVRAN